MCEDEAPTLGDAIPHAHFHPDADGTAIPHVNCHSIADDAVNAHAHADPAAHTDAGAGLLVGDQGRGHLHPAACRG